MTAPAAQNRTRTTSDSVVSIDSGSAIYQNGSYLRMNPSWHLEESPFKVKQIRRMLKEQRMAPQSICDVGCGAGLVLQELQPHLPSSCVCWGYDVSPDAIGICKSRENENLHFEVCDIRRSEGEIYFDLLLMLDVFEHVEDYIGLLRAVKPKARQKLFHIPLDLSVQAVTRKNGLLLRRDHYAHLHYFTKETALRTLTDIGYKIVAHFYTPRCIELGDLPIQKMLRIPRRLCFAVSPEFTVRMLGGYSLMVLAE